MTEFAPIIADVAKHFWGEPNRRHSKKSELRWGTNGARSVDIAKGTWFDHEAKQGGGVIDLLRREGIADASMAARERLCRRRRRTATSSARSSRPTTTPTRPARCCFRLSVTTIQRPSSNGGRMVGAVGSGTSRASAQVPYRLPELLEAIALDHPVFVVEGEKDVETLARYGIAATTNAGGAGKWKADFAEHFAGADVVVIPDNDDTGRNHANDVARSLAGTAARVRRLELPGLPDKGDVSDWFGAGGTVEVFNALADAAPDWTDAGTQGDGAAPARIDLARYDSEPIPAREWGVPERFPRRNVCLLSGEGGRGKSIILLQLAAAHVLGKDWLRSLPEQGPVIMVNAEDEEGEIVRRLKPILDHYGARFADVAPASAHLFAGRRRPAAGAARPQRPHRRNAAVRRARWRWPATFGRSASSSTTSPTCSAPTKSSAARCASSSP